MAEVQALEYGVTNNNVPNKPTNLFVSNVNKENAAMDTYQLPFGPKGPRTLVMTSSKSSNWKPVLTEEGKKLSPDYQKFLINDVSKEADNQRAAYINKSFTPVQKETLFKGAPKVNNTASPSEVSQKGDQQTANPQDFNKTLQDLKISDAAGGVRESYGDKNYKYPIDANFSLQDCIMFSMYRYKPKKVELTSDLGAFKAVDKGSVMGRVTLPIQPGISDSNGVSWGESSMNAIQAAGSAAALSTIAKGGEGAEESLNTIVKGIRENKSDISKMIAANFAGGATGANQDFLTRATGAVLNNNLELLFSGPSLRSFTFNFSLSAREQKEAEMIRKIIRFFKQGMSVKRSESTLFLQTPNIFDIKYLHKGKDHPYINQIKTCALQNCMVNYTPAGNYATYEDGAMTQYDITLTFGEIEPLFDDDYKNLVPGGNSDTHIGF